MGGLMAQRGATREQRIPEKIGKYVIVKEVGRGSTGVVFICPPPK